MAIPKPHKITHPFTPSVAEDIDFNFDLLFKRVALGETTVLGVTLGGTGLGSWQVGDLIYADTATSLAGLHAVAAGNVVISQGTNTAPIYGKVALSGSVTHITGILPIANGGTNASTKTEAFDNLSPTTTKGDLIAHNGSDNVRVPVGTDGQVLVADSGATAGVSWDDPTSLHELLQENVHTDTKTQTRVLGDLISALAENAEGDFWLDGERFGAGVTGADTSGLRFWHEGRAFTRVFAGASSDQVRWQRLPIGASGLFLKSTGLRPEWGPLGDVGEITASEQPIVKVYKTANQSITNGANPSDFYGGYAVTWDSEEFDAQGFHSGSASELIVPSGKSGVYLIVGQASWETMTAGVRAAAWIYRNGERRAIAEMTAPSGGLNFSFTLATFQVLSDGDEIELYVRQEDASAKQLLGDAVDLSLTQLALVKLA